MVDSYGLDDLVREMRRVATATTLPAEIPRHLTAPARRLALEPGWLEPRFHDCDPSAGFAIHSLHEEADHGLSVVLAALLPGRDLPPHNHKTWALQVGIESDSLNIAWRRTDDGSRPGHAELEETGRLTFGPGDVLTFMPEDTASSMDRADWPCRSISTASAMPPPIPRNSIPGLRR
jgi:predicted metal-dependent enzyme (double-stranded beta helix superfamily)